MTVSHLYCNLDPEGLSVLKRIFRKETRERNLIFFMKRSPLASLTRRLPVLWGQKLAGRLVGIAIGMVIGMVSCGRSRNSVTHASVSSSLSWATGTEKFSLRDCSSVDWCMSWYGSHWVTIPNTKPNKARTFVLRVWWNFSVISGSSDRSDRSCSSELVWKCQRQRIWTRQELKNFPRNLFGAKKLNLHLMSLLPNWPN